jgi:amino-acid N-acetyltransferase
MPKLYMREYSRALSGETVFIACREGILRDYFQEIISDIKFLVRHGIHTTLLHNVSNRFSNQKLFKRLKFLLPDVDMIRVPPETDFYAFALDYRQKISKIIFLERKHLTDPKGRNINAIAIHNDHQNPREYGEIISNVNFRGPLEKICKKIEAGVYKRVHVLPAGKNAIKRELFTIEGSGTIIARDFHETFSGVVSEKQADMVSGILGIYKGEGFLKPRSKAYIIKNLKNFYVTRIDGIIVGCVEKKHLDDTTAELGALAISTRFLNQRVGVFTINSFIAEMRLNGYGQFISLTNNPSLSRLYLSLGFEKKSPLPYRRRQDQSPGVSMFYKKV